MTICFLPRNFFAALCLLTMFAFGAGCATHQEQPGTPPAADSGAQPGSDADASDAPLQSVQVRKGQTVHVAVSGGDASFNADFESMLTSYLQSEKDLTPADSAQKADLLIRVKVEDIYPLGSRNAPVSAGHALGSTATGAMLGVLLGGTTGGRSGARLGGRRRSGPWPGRGPAGQFRQKQNMGNESSCGRGPQRTGTVRCGHAPHHGAR